jgi:hypothetical protein
MRKRPILCLLSCLWPLVPVSALYAQQAPIGVLPDANGNLGAVGPRAAVPITPSTACLQLYNDTAVFNFNVTLDPDVYPYTITGGTITGSICGAPWTVTGGSLGKSLSIKGKRAPIPSCASTMSVTGNFDVPDSYIGTYSFDGLSTAFSHHTLFLGYQRANCP